jgi:hypothetical protein
MRAGIAKGNPIADANQQLFEEGVAERAQPNPAEGE